jgi:hypothetical protein
MNNTYGVVSAPPPAWLCWVRGRLGEWAIAGVMSDEAGAKRLLARLGAVGMALPRGVRPPEEMEGAD